MAEENKVVDSADVSELDTVSEQIKEQESAAKEASVVDETIPEKYRGMSVKELASRLETTNKDLGRYTNELGEVRKLADELIKSSLNKPKEQEVGKEIDFFENPQEAVRRAVESNPTLQNAANYADQARKDLAKQRMYQLHPDADKIIQDEQFIQWIDKSPVRKQLFNQAYNFDVNAADELLSTFKELRTVRQAQVSDVEKTARTKSMNAASVDTGGTGERSKKIMKRADLMNLMIRDRKKYDSMQDEIMLAYSEGRVK
jgi:hypothetical protein